MLPRYCLLLFTAFVLNTANAQPSSHDHPLISPFKGAQRVGLQRLDFDQGAFYPPNQNPGYDAKKELDMDAPIVKEGRVTRLLYITPAGKTPLEVFRNYEQALMQAGVSAVTNVDGRGAWWRTGKHWRDNFQQLDFEPPFASDISPFDRGDAHYFFGTLARQSGDVAVSVLVGPVSSFTKDVYKTPDTSAQAAVAIQIVEASVMATGQVTVSANAIYEALDNQGKIALYGLYFDSGKSDITAASKTQLDEIAQFLSTYESLRLFVVGHTDNTGTLAGNIALSQQRAESVVKTLIDTYGIAPTRLVPKGVANFAPVASHATEQGRALNRRVELVLQ